MDVKCFSKSMLVNILSFKYALKHNLGYFHFLRHLHSVWIISILSYTCSSRAVHCLVCVNTFCIPLLDKCSFKGEKISLCNLTPRSDKHADSPCDFNTLSTKQVMRITTPICWGVFSWYTTKFSCLIYKEMSDSYKGELLIRP